MISIIIPIYNSAKFLDICLESISKQTYKEFECILIDDGSTDSSSSICQEWLKQDPRFRFIYQYNAGVSAARNRGMQEAKNEYITFIDSDDWVGPHYLEHLLSSQHEEYDLILSGLEFVYKNETSRMIQPKDVEFSFDNIDTDTILDFYKKFLFCGPMSKLYKRSIILDNNIIFPTDRSYGEDLIFNHRYLDCTKKIKSIQSIDYYYRHTSDGESLSSSLRKNRFENDCFLWDVVGKFFSKKRIDSPAVHAYRQKELWGIFYDSIFQFKKVSDNPWERYIYIRKILYSDFSKYLDKMESPIPKWIKILILRKHTLLLFIILSLRLK